MLPRSLALVPALFSAACLIGLAGGARAQSETVTYDLDNVWLLPDVTHPFGAARQMTGTFEWTYTVGDFDNGAGQFLTYQIPWWTQAVPLSQSIDLDTIEFTMPGKFHDLGLDIALKVTADLSPSLSSPIDTVLSSFDIQVGSSHRGHVISGSLVPRCPTPANYGVGTAGTGDLVPGISHQGGNPRIGNSAFAIVGDQLLGGAFGAVFLGPQAAQIDVLGFALLVDPNSAAVVSVVASGPLGSPGVGSFLLPVAIPDLPALIGSQFYIQVIVGDLGSQGGLIAASDGLSIVLCQ